MASSTLVLSVASAMMPCALATHSLIKGGNTLPRGVGGSESEASASFSDLSSRAARNSNCLICCPLPTRPHCATRSLRRQARAVCWSALSIQYFSISEINRTASPRSAILASASRAGLNSLGVLSPELLFTLSTFMLLLCRRCFSWRTSRCARAKANVSLSSPVLCFSCRRCRLADLRGTAASRTFLCASCWRRKGCCLGVLCTAPSRRASGGCGRLFFFALCWLSPGPCFCNSICQAAPFPSVSSSPKLLCESCCRELRTAGGCATGGNGSRGECVAAFSTGRRSLCRCRRGRRCDTSTSARPAWRTAATEPLRGSVSNAANHQGDLSVAACGRINSDAGSCMGCRACTGFRTCGFRADGCFGLALSEGVGSGSGSGSSSG